MIKNFVFVMIAIMLTILLLDILKTLFYYHFIFTNDGIVVFCSINMLRGYKHSFLFIFLQSVLLNNLCKGLFLQFEIMYEFVDNRVVLL